MSNYRYSMDLSSYFTDDEEDKKDVQPETGIMQRNASKAAATAEPEQPAYDPYAFMPKFVKSLETAYENKEQARTVLGGLAKNPAPEDVRMREINDYITSSTRATAIEDALMGLNLPEYPQDMPSAGTLGPLEGDQTLPAVPGVSTSPLGPRSMGTPALSFDEVPTPMSLDPTILDYATQSSLPDVEAIIDEIMLDRGGEKAITSETPEEREQYRGKGEGLMSKKLDGKDGNLDAYKFKDTDVITKAKEIAPQEGEITKDSVVKQVRDVVGDNIYAAGILGAFTAESGVNFDSLEENTNYSLANAQSVFNQDKIDNALQAVSPEVRTKILNGGRDRAFGEALMSHYGGGGRYHGRGLIHITHDYNYRRVGEKIGVDLVNNPELVNDPRYAVPAAIAFLEMNGYFKEDTPPTKERLQRIVNRWAPTSVKNKRWAAAQDYLKSFKEVPTSSERPKARPGRFKDRP
jgi:predicted chitinase